MIDPLSKTEIVMNSGFRSMGDELRHRHSAALDEIEDIIICALDQLVEEAVAWGADEQHNFNTDAAGAKAVKRIALELDRATAEVIRKLGSDQ